MSKASGLTHILTELSSLDELGQVLKRSSRLKYTGISVSRRFIALGSNKGGIYIFTRDTLKYLRVIFVEKETNPVVSLSLSPSDQHIGVASSTGFVAVFELNIDKRDKPDRVRQSFSHSGHGVTSLTWDAAGTKLFVGDDQGRISVLFVPSNKSKQLFALPSEVLAQLNDGVFQMTWWQEKLLVSTLTFCYLFDTTKQTYSTIGSQKREGRFGACIFLEPNSQCPVIYCARPRSRIWEVDFNGTVLNTHQFKQLLAVPPVTVVNFLTDSYSPSTKMPAKEGMSISFNKMIHAGRLILTWSDGGLYFFDPINVKVMIWTDMVKDVKDIVVYGNDVYIFNDQASITKLTLLPIYQVFQILATRANWNIMADLLLSSDVINVRPAVMKQVKKDLLDSLISGLADKGDSAMVEKIRASMEDISEGSVDSLNMADDLLGSTEILGHTRLPSGMIIINDGSSRAASPAFGGSSRAASPAFGVGDPRCMSPEFRDPRDSRCLSPRFQDRPDPRCFSPALKEEQERESYGSNDGGQTTPSYQSEDTANSEQVQIEVKDISFVPHQNGNETLNGQQLEQNGHVTFDEQMNDAKTEDPGSNNVDSNHDDEREKVNEFVQNSPPQESLSESNSKDMVSEDRTKNEKDNETLNERNEESNSSQIFQEITLTDEVFDNTQENKEQNVADAPSSEIKVHPENSRDVVNSNKLSSTSSLEMSNEGRQEQTSGGHLKPRGQQESIPVKKSFGGVKAGDKETIAESVKPSKKKKKKKNSPGLMARSMSLQKLDMKGQMHVSRSCSDLSEKTLYLHCGNEDTVSLNLEETNEEELDQVSNSSSDYRKSSVGSIEQTLCPEESVEVLPPAQVSMKGRQQEVIPSLLDRLTAAGVTQPHADNNNAEEDLDMFDSLLSSKAPSLLALKDGLSSKLKTQTKSLINKGKTLLVKSASSPHFNTSTSHANFHSLDSFRSTREEHSNHMLQEDIILEADDSAREPSKETKKQKPSVDDGVRSMLSVQIHSLCLRAAKIDRQLKDLSLLLNPPKMVRLLEEWAEELNRVSYEFHYLRCQKLKDLEADDEFIENPANVSQSTVKGRMIHDKGQSNTMTSDYERLHVENPSDSDRSLENSFEKSCPENRSNGEEYEQKHSLPELNGYNDTDTSINSTPKESSSVAPPILPVEYLRDLRQVSDPFHLSPEHLQLFQNLTTLCFSCRATGDVLQCFHLSERSQQLDFLRSILPQGLDHSFISGCEPPFREFGRGFDLSKTDVNLNDVDSSVRNPVLMSHGIENEENNGVSIRSSTTSKDGESLSDSMLSELCVIVFLHLYFFTLDFCVVKQDFDSRLDGISLAWISLVNCCQERGKRDIVNSILADSQVNSAIDYLRSGILLHPSAMLGHIYNLFDHAPAKTSEFCGEIHSSISAADMVRLSWLKSKSPSTMLLRYGKKIMIDLLTIQRPTAFDKLCEHRIVRHLLLENLLPFQDVRQEELGQGDSAKSLPVQFLTVLPTDWLERILKAVESNEERESIISLGMELGNWKLCVRLLTDNNQRDRMFELVVQKGRLDLLQGKSLPHSLDEWRRVIQYYIEKMKKEKGVKLDDLSNGKVDVVGGSDHKDIKHGEIDLHTEGIKTDENENGNVEQIQKEAVTAETHQNCESSVMTSIAVPDHSTSGEASDNQPLSSKEVSLNDLGRCLLDSVSGIMAVDLLLEFMKELEENKESLDPVLLNACYTDFRILMKQDHICHEALERMSVYMWTQHPAYLPPSVHHTVKAEALCKVNNEDDVNLQSVISRLRLTSSSDFTEEHMGNHWGFNADMKRNCPSCNLSLSVNMSIDFPGVVVFPCGHMFHKRCVCSEACPFMH